MNRCLAKQQNHQLRQKVTIHDGTAAGGKYELFLPLPLFLSAKLLLALHCYKDKEIFSFNKGTGWLYSSRRRRFTKNKSSSSNLTFELVISRVMIHTT